MLNDFSWVGQIFSATNGVWTLVAIITFGLFRAWPLILGKINERKRDDVAEKAGDWVRLRDEVTRLAARVEVLEQKVEECESERDAALKRAVTAETELIKLEAYNQGRGEGMQTAQVILSSERKKDEDHK